jgi:hypothetical protein
MQSQAKSLARLKVLILGLTAFLLVFSMSGFVLLDVYLLSSVSETRLKFLDRTLSYFQSSIKACISLRSLHLDRNMSDPLNMADIEVSPTATCATTYTAAALEGPPTRGVARQTANQRRHLSRI